MFKKMIVGFAGASIAAALVTSPASALGLSINLGPTTTVAPATPTTVAPVTTTTAAPATTVPAILVPLGTEFSSTVSSFPSVVQGSDVWIPGTWLGRVEVQDFKVTAKSSDTAVAISYPGGRDYSSLSVDSTLSPSELDFNAIHVVVPTTAVPGVKLVTVTVSYKVSGVARSWTALVPITVVAYTGGTFTQVTQSVSVPADATANWVNVSFLGVEPLTEGLRFKITDAKGAVVSYPSDGTTTGLHKDGNLSAGETDLVAFKVGAGTLKAGTYNLTWGATYGASGSKTATGTLQLVVS